MSEQQHPLKIVAAMEREKKKVPQKGKHHSHNLLSALSNIQTTETIAPQTKGETRETAFENKKLEYARESDSGAVGITFVAKNSTYIVHISRTSHKCVVVKQQTSNVSAGNLGLREFKDVGSESQSAERDSQ